VVLGVSWIIIAKLITAFQPDELFLFIFSQEHAGSQVLLLSLTAECTDFYEIPGS